MNTTVNEATTLLNKEDMMNSTLDGIPTSGGLPPEGAYILRVVSCKTYDFKKKDGTDSWKINILYKIVECLELVDSEAMPPALGGVFSESFMGTAQGMDFFRTKATKILGVTDVKGCMLKDIMQNLLLAPPVHAMLTVKRTAKNKDDASAGEYENIQVKIVAQQQDNTPSF